MTEEKDENRKDGDDMGEINGTEWNFEKSQKQNHENETIFIY